MNRLAILLVTFSVLGVQAMAAEGLISRAGNYGPKETMDRLEFEIRSKGMTIFARIDHAAAAAAVGLPLRSTELLIFGNARAGTPLMQRNQAIGVDLPLMALVWQDASGSTWLSYDDPIWLAQRHGLGDESDATVNALSTTLSAVGGAAIRSL